VALFGPPNVTRLARANKIAELVKAAHYKKDEAVREAAREALTEKVDLLIQTLQSKHLPHVYAAREALVVVGEPARERLIFILREGHVHRRQDAAFVLGEMGDPAAVPALRLAMHNPDPLLRMICVQALGKIGDEEGFETLRQALGDADPQVAREARKALDKIARAGR
jgi:HEAT repeat protein